MNRAVFFAALLTIVAAPAAAQPCALEYQRADNMFAAAGRPDGQLGKETLTLEPGQTKVFTTDWKYEKRRNDGANYYGSHARIVRNAGQREMRIVFKGQGAGTAIGAAIAALKQDPAQKDRLLGALNPGVSWLVHADLMEVSCKSADKEAKVSPPTGLVATQISPREIVLRWQKVPDAKEYRVYVNPPPQPHLAGRPGVIGGNGTSWVIMLPQSAASSTAYYASIETVGQTGATSERVQFNPVAVHEPGGTPQGGGAGGPTPAGTSEGTAGQRCPPGQFVTGLDSAGKVLCAKP